METETVPTTSQVAAAAEAANAAAAATAAAARPASREAALVTRPSAAVASPTRNVHAGASPFRLVVDPAMRADLRRGLFELIDHHDAALATYVADGKLSLDSYKEYIELFARSLRETMDSREGVLYLLRSAGVELGDEQINLEPEWRWK